MVRRVKVGAEFVRLDVRCRGTNITTVTIASDTTEPLTAETIANVVARYAVEPPQMFRTPAITRAEAFGYERCGFEVVSVLRLLTHDLEHLPRRSPLAVTSGQGRRIRIDHCVDIDRQAFGPDQSFDRLDLLAALDATTHSRLRIIMPNRSERTGPAGFAVTGRAGNRGYLQRVAVDPAEQGTGIGSALVIDALRWCRMHRVAKVVVNTATDNDRALALYRRLGFVDTALDLLLMERRA